MRTAWRMALFGAAAGIVGGVAFFAAAAQHSFKPAPLRGAASSGVTAVPNLTRLLTRAEFLATFRDPMLDITGREDEFSPDGVIDLGSYMASIPNSELLGHSLLGNDVVEFVKRSGDNRFDQVVYPCREKNVYLVVVVSLDISEPYGHFLIDLNREYGLDRPLH